MGIDLSLTGTGLLSLPFSWGLDWRKAQRAQVGYLLPEKASVMAQMQRLHRLTVEVLAFARAHRVTHVWIEEYAFSRGASRAHALGELGGAVKLALVMEARLPVEVVHVNSARALLGKMPRKDAKDEAHIRLTAAGAPLEWSRDALDAFLVLNYGFSALRVVERPAAIILAA